MLMLVPWLFLCPTNHFSIGQNSSYISLIKLNTLTLQSELYSSPHGCVSAEVTS